MLVILIGFAPQIIKMVRIRKIPILLEKYKNAVEMETGNYRKAGITSRIPFSMNTPMIMRT
jgi:hypothetical protein